MSAVTGTVRKKHRSRRYLVTAMFDVEADSMQEAAEQVDVIMQHAQTPYVCIKDKDSELAYEHFADGQWKKYANKKSH